MNISAFVNDLHKLALLKESSKLFVDELSEEDRVVIVVFTDVSRLVLEGTHGIYE